MIEMLLFWPYVVDFSVIPIVKRLKLLWRIFFLFANVEIWDFNEYFCCLIGLRRMKNYLFDVFEDFTIGKDDRRGFMGTAVASSTLFELHNNIACRMYTNPDLLSVNSVWCTYIIDLYNPAVRITELVSHTTYVC